jgi:hypothetical protein
MKLAMVFTFALGALAFGCSSSSASSDSGGPVAAKPLDGTIDGQSFTAKVGLAHKGFDATKKSIDIYDADATCDKPVTSPKREILIDVPWSAGTSTNFSFSLSGGGQTATFVVDNNGTPNNIISSSGRVEIVDAPSTAGSTGKIRIRASAEGNNVEGEVSVLVCD